MPIILATIACQIVCVIHAIKHNRNQIWAGRMVHKRAELLDAKKVLESAALDEYQFVRDAYLQRRRNLVYDGKPPPDKDLTVKPPAPEPDKTQKPK